MSDFAKVYDWISFFGENSGFCQNGWVVGIQRKTNCSKVYWRDDKQVTSNWN